MTESAGRARPAPWSLQARVLATVIGLVTGVWLVAVVATWIDTRHELNELMDGHLAQAASFFAMQSLDALDGDDFPPAPVLHKSQPRVAFQVWHEGRLVVRSVNAPQLPLGDRVSRRTQVREVQGQTWRVLGTVGKEDDVVIYIGEHESARRDVLMASLRGVLWPFALALPLLALGVWWAVRGSMRPLRELGAVVAVRRPGVLDPMPLDAAPPEVRPLLTALNGLFDRVARMLESERRFNADAAHELRTPIAAIRMQAQVAQGATSDADRAQALAATVQGCDRAARLVEQLLQLSRLEGEPVPTPTAHADLGAVVRQVAQDLQPMAAARGQRMDCDLAAAALPICMAPALAQALLRNLVDNALRYSPQDGVVRVTAAQDAGGVLSVVVEDSGPGMAPDAMARLGERFFRVLGTATSGSGLGWSIVQRIARLHGLGVTLTRSAALGGLHVRVTWPLAGEAAKDASAAKKSVEE